MRKVKKVFLVIILFLIFVPTIFAKTTDYTHLDMSKVKLDSIKANHILLYNLNDQKVVYQIGNDDKISIASLTKIMTSLVTIEKNEDLDKVVTVPSEAFLNIDGYAEAGFKAGEKVTIRDLLYGTLLPSGVEAAQSLAIITSGNIKNFVDEMNNMASKIGLQNTHYENPVGRDNKENYSTLSDLLALLKYALGNETFYEIYTTRIYESSNGLELKSTLVNPSTKYSLNIDSIKGSKSGFTKDAGLCLSSIAEYENTKYLLIIANSLYQNGFPNHIVDSLNIYKYFSNNYNYQNILTEGQILTTLKVEDGYQDTYDVISNETIPFYLEKESTDKITYIYSGIDTIDYKIKQNEKLGSVSIFYNDTLLYTYPVYLNTELKFKYTKFFLIGLIILGVILIGIIFHFFKKKKNKKNK